MSVASFLSVMNILLRIGHFYPFESQLTARWTILSLKTLADFDILLDVSRNDGSGVNATSSGLSRCSEFYLKQ